MTRAQTDVRPPSALSGVAGLSLARTAWPVLLLSLAGLLWSYWPTIAELIEFWSKNPDYSVGALVPLVVIWLLWRQRSQLGVDVWRPSGVGLGLLLASQLVRFAGLYYGYASIERFSLVLTIASLVWLVCGWGIFRRLLGIQAFLLLMVPLPGRIHNAIALPLQEGATTLTAFGLELMGFFVVREGNVLRVEEHATVAVTEACSGLRMLTAFVFIAALLCLLIDRPLWERATLLALSIPVAVLSNALRGVTTACVVYYSDSDVVSESYHDLAGLAMMPLALVLSLGLIRFMDFLAGREAQPSAVAGNPPARRATRKGQSRATAR